MSEILKDFCIGACLYGGIALVICVYIKMPRFLKHVFWWFFIALFLNALANGSFLGYFIIVVIIAFFDNFGVVDTNQQHTKKSYDDKTDKHDLDFEFDFDIEKIRPIPDKQSATHSDSQKELDTFWEREKSNQEKGTLYERYIGYIYESKGYLVEYFGIKNGVKDNGCDLICRKDSTTLIIQCKNWNNRQIIHAKYIHQLYGTKTHYARHSKHLRENVLGVFCTTTRFAYDAINAANMLNITLSQCNMPERFPIIKCKDKIYYLPTDKDYNNITLVFSNGDCYCETVAEAEEKGFHRYGNIEITELKDIPIDDNNNIVDKLINIGLAHIGRKTNRKNKYLTDEAIIECVSIENPFLDLLIYKFKDDNQRKIIKDKFMLFKETCLSMIYDVVLRNDKELHNRIKIDLQAILTEGLFSYGVKNRREYSTMFKKNFRDEFAKNRDINKALRQAFWSTIAAKYPEWITLESVADILNNRCLLNIFNYSYMAIKSEYENYQQRQGT